MTRIVIVGDSLGVRLVGDLSTLLLLVIVGLTMMTVLTLTLVGLLVVLISQRFKMTLGVLCWVPGFWDGL